MVSFGLKKPTPSEYAVLVVSSSVLFVVVRAISLVVAIQAPEREHELAQHFVASFRSTRLQIVKVLGCSAASR
jgi:hypothetical protein